MGGFTRNLMIFGSILLLLPLTSSATSLQDALNNVTEGLGIGNVQLPPGATKGAWKDLVTLLDAHRGDSKQAILTLKSYFTRFGYLNASGNATMDFGDDLQAAVRLYQQNFKLPVTGTLDLATISQLVKPRCGREDVLNGVSHMVSHGHKNRSTMAHTVQHYSFFEGLPRWTSKNNLGYYIDYSTLPSSNSLSADQVQAAIRNAFSKWSATVPLSFYETRSMGSADITISFDSFDHGDQNPFDGQSGVLAHAFAPENGRLHFDASETWVADVDSDTEPTAVHFESVAVHEIGHVIGLSHSNDQTAIMFPSIGFRQAKTSLSQDDIEGAQQLYGGQPSDQQGSTRGVGMIATSGDIGLSHPLWWQTAILATVAVLL